MFSCFSKLDVDHLYMSYADIMAKVRHGWSLISIIPFLILYQTEIIYIPQPIYEITLCTRNL